ncbi:MAG: AAA family ATPase [bacterium]|nr:AAA family ATPase [bacterium]
MLIAIAGTIGAGKSTVARAVSSRLAIPYHAIDDDKSDIGEAHPEFTTWVAGSIPFPDDFRTAVFDQALDQLTEMAAEHDHVIVEETFHRRHIRDPFFQAAATQLNGLVLIEIVVARDVALAHLAKRARTQRNHLAGPAMYDSFQAITDPLERVDLAVENNGNLRDTVDQVCRFLETRLNCPAGTG